VLNRLQRIARIQLKLNQLKTKRFLDVPETALGTWDLGYIP
jgi:hypothetical protein